MPSFTPNGAQTSNLAAQGDASNPQMISALETGVNNILGLSGQSVQDAYTALAQETAAQGYAQQAQDYGAATQISDQNAALTQASAQIQGYQQKAQAGRTIGTMIATRAANGFGNAGTPLMMLRGSLMQSALTQQLTQTQGNINAGGYLEQAAASSGEQAAATTAENSANIYGQAAQTGSQISSASAAQEASLLAQEVSQALAPAISPNSGSGQLSPWQSTTIGAGVPQSVSTSLPSIIQSALNGLPANLSEPINGNLNGVSSASSAVNGSLDSLFAVASLPLQIQNGWPMS